MKPWLLPALWTGDVLSIVSVFHMFEIVLSKKTALWNCALACTLPQTIYAIFIHWKRPHTPEFNTNFIRFPWQTMTKQMFAAVISVSLSMKTKKHQNNGKKHLKNQCLSCKGNAKKNIRSKRQVIHGMGELLPTRPVQKCCPRPCCHIGYQDLICSSPCAFSTVVVPTQPFTNTALYYKMLLESEPTPPATKCFWGFWWWIKNQCGSLQNGYANGSQWKIMILY